MDDGGKISTGLKLCTNNFNLLEVQVLSFLLNVKYNLNTSVISAGYKDQYHIYIPNNSIHHLFN
jgi:hypothetical protein